MWNKLRISVAWALYWIGDKVCDLNDYLFPETGRLYWLYNKLMCWSDDVQGDIEGGPWETGM